MGNGPVVETTAGKVEGELLDGVSRFLGIPFAGSAAGAGRWKAPPPPEGWSGVRPATAFGSIIPQPTRGVPGGLIRTDLAHSEVDGLSVNVWTPGADGERRPTIVIVSCGAFTFSSGADPTSDGERLARKHDIVVATFNCRPGLLGFLYLGDVLGEEYAAGNAGLLDQIAALEWVRDNIEGFGGDPQNVTVQGCSGSAFSIAAMMAMPRAKGLFGRAIVESGADFGSNERGHSSEFAEQVLHGLGLAGNPRGLLDVSAERLIEIKGIGAASHQAGHGATRGGPVPVVDKVTLPAQPLVAWASGSADDVDLLIGSNREEMNMQLPPGMSTDAIAGIMPTAVEDLGQVVETMAASCDGLAIEANGTVRAESLVEGYRALHPDRSLSELLNFMRSEMLFRIAATRMAEAQMVGSGRPVYVYLFSWGAAMHGLEVPFALDNLARAFAGGDLTAVPGAQDLSDVMSSCWTAFARSGDPSNPTAGSWPAYSLDQRETMVFDSVSQVVRDPLGAERTLWHGVPLGNRTLLAGQQLRRPSLVAS
jgi:para-nitrobenzyl esterase